jgi:hypothetical protein
VAGVEEGVYVVLDVERRNAVGHEDHDGTTSIPATSKAKRWAGLDVESAASTTAGLPVAARSSTDASFQVLRRWEGIVRPGHVTDTPARQGGESRHHGDKPHAAVSTHALA